MSSAGWPYSPGQCPQCRYLQPFDPPLPGDDGYAVVGFCRHPRIAMDLHELKRRTPAPCPCFFPQRGAGDVPKHPG